MAMPAPDFSLCLFLIPERVQMEEQFKTLIVLSHYLETIRFRQFWDEAAKSRQIVEVVPGFEQAIQDYAIHVLSLTYQKVPRSVLAETEKDRADFLKKMRNPKMEPLKKSELFKRIVKRCTVMASGKKAIKCSKCGYINGNCNKDGLYSVLLRDYNAHAAVACMNRLTKLSARWIGNHGFSIGIDDVQPGGHLNDNKRAKILEGYESCDKLIHEYNEGMLKLQPGCDSVQTLEVEITVVLNNIRETAAKGCAEELHWRNSPLIMSQCGSKGSIINIGQMIACVGQQIVGGRRAPNGFIDRSLPHFPRNARWIGNHGFSIGIDDVQPGGHLNDNKRAKILEGYESCDKLIHEYNEGMLKPQPGCDSVQTLEAEITVVLNNIRETAAKGCAEELHWRNSPLIMSQCGSKGSIINIGQMIACVGQQIVGGRRAPNGFIDQSLPHFPRKSKTPSAGWLDLQMEVAQYINNDVSGVPLHMQAARPLSGFVQRLKGKQGCFRENLSGKRVEYTGRTVISPDPNLKITEVAIPILMAQILTYPESVSHHNIEKLRQCVRNGPNKYPGAKFIRQPDGTQIGLIISSRKRFADELKFGYIVDRHLEDGDIVLFNRQPSLHRMSIMCHRARIMPWRTLRFNESVCNPYNADFDGDEMNLHVPQIEEARTEAIMLMGVQNNLCTPKNGEILVASTQDFLTSSFLITRKDTFYDRASFSLICSYIGDGMDPIDLPSPALIKAINIEGLSQDKFLESQVAKCGWVLEKGQSKGQLIVLPPKEFNHPELKKNSADNIPLEHITRVFPILG